MPLPKENSRRARALIELGHAQQSIQTAISLLGGWTRVRSVKKDPLTFALRKMIESIDSRLNVIIAALSTREPPAAWNEPQNLEFKTRLDRMLQLFPEINLRDDFEREYHRTREPQC